MPANSPNLPKTLTPVLGTVRMVGGLFAAYDATQRLLGVFAKPAEAALAILKST